MKKIIIVLIAFFSISTTNFYAQDIDDLLDSELDNTKSYATATFKSTHINNSHSVAQLKKNHLNFIIYHRFGTISSGIDQFFGLDVANMRLGFEYAASDWLTIGVGRSNFEATYDGFMKMQLLRQSKGGKWAMPITLTYIGMGEFFTKPFDEPDRNNYLSSRLTYIHQILIARKFNEKLSLQIMPTVVHKNLVETVLELNDLPALGIGGRYKLTNRLALTFEYYATYRLTNHNIDYHNPLSIGIDIETGGHVFQFVFSNSGLMQEGGYIYGKNNDDFFNGDIHLGFNITRVFSFNH